MTQQIVSLVEDGQTSYSYWLSCGHARVVRDSAQRSFVGEPLYCPTCSRSLEVVQVRRISMGNGQLVVFSRIVDAAIPSLTPREGEVLRLLAEGMRSPEMGDRLGISPRTVAQHVRRILFKLRANTRAQAVAEATKRGLL